MKNKFYMILILVLVSFTGCANQEDANIEPKVLNDNGDMLVSRSNDYEMVFESVEVGDEGKYPLLRLSEKGIVKDILSDGEILLAEGPKLSLYDMDTNKKTTLVEEAYNVAISHDKSFLVYENDKGIYLFSLETKESTRLHSIEDEIFRSLIISQDNQSILLQTIKGEEFKSYAIDMNGDVNELNIKEDESFILNDLVHYDGNYLMGIGQMSGAADQELMNWVTNLVRINLSNGSIKNITNLEADDQISALGDYDEDEHVIKIVKSTMNSQEEIQRTVEIKRLNTTRGYLSRNLPLEDTAALKVIDNKNYIYLEETEEYNYTFPDTMNIVLEENGKINRIGLVRTGIPTELFVYEDQLIFNSNEDIYCIQFR